MCWKEVGDDEAWVKKMLRDKADSLALMDRVLGHRSLPSVCDDYFQGAGGGSAFG